MEKRNPPVRQKSASPPGGFYNLGLDAEFDKKLEEQNKKFSADKPAENTLSTEMKEHYSTYVGKL